MPLLFADQWLNPSLIHTVGWTFLHSLWQGLIAALIALVILGLTRKSTPLLRYNLLLLLFAFFVITIAITFSIHDSTKPQYVNVAIGSFVIQHHSLNNFSSLIAGQTQNYLSGFEIYFNRYAYIFVTFWFLIFCVQGVRFILNLGYVSHIRNFRTSVPADGWNTQCNQLKNRLGIQKPVLLLESAIVKVPLVIGILKPLILLPVGLLSNIPHEQVESILLHELAHIKRRDYLVNLIQTMVEIIFFFNPAILWISKLLRKEREACCDEIAVRHLQSKSHYIQALMSFQEYALGSPGHAITFPGRKNYLLQRVKRIINNENKKLNYMEKTILFCGIIAITALSVFSTMKAGAQNDRVAGQLSSSAKIDTIPKKSGKTMLKRTSENKRAHTKVTTDDNGSEKIVVLESNDGSRRDLKAKLLNNRIAQLSINGKTIDSKKFNLYEEEIKSLIDEQHHLQDEIVQKQAEQQTGLENQLKREAEQQKILQLEYENKLKGQAEEQRLQQLNMEKLKDRALQQTTQQMNEVEKMKSQIDQIRMQEERKAITESMKEQPLNRVVQLTHKNSGKEDSHEPVKGILAFLEKNNVIKGKDGTTFKLTNDQLLVNGVKQPAALHLELKQKYIYNPGDYYTFSCSGGTSEITVHRVD